MASMNTHQTSQPYILLARHMLHTSITVLLKYTCPLILKSGTPASSIIQMLTLPGTYLRGCKMVSVLVWGTLPTFVQHGQTCNLPNKTLK